MNAPLHLCWLACPPALSHLASRSSSLVKRIFYRGSLQCFKLGSYHSVHCHFGIFHLFSRMSVLLFLRWWCGAGNETITCSYGLYLVANTNTTDLLHSINNVYHQFIIKCKTLRLRNWLLGEKPQWSSKLLVIAAWVWRFFHTSYIKHTFINGKDKLNLSKYSNPNQSFIHGFASLWWRNRQNSILTYHSIILSSF